MTARALRNGPERSRDEQFVGRCRELAVLHAQLGRACEGRSSLVVLEGPAGIGKTALAGEFLSAIENAVVLDVSGEEGEAELPYGVLGQLSAQFEPLPEALASLPGPGAAAQPDPLVVGAALLELLGRLQRTSPVVIAVDGAGWADLPSLHALTFALRRLRTDRVLTLLIARESDDPRLPDGLRRLLRSSAALRLPLSGLSARELQALSARLGPVRLTPQAAERLHEHTKGVPLHARALLQQVRAETLADVDAPLPAPRAYTTLVLDRLGFCEDAAQRLLTAAAVLGTSAPLHLVARMAGLAEPLAALEQAARAGLLAEWRTGAGVSVGFPNPLIRAAVYHDLGPATRRRLHLLAAELVDDVVHRLHHRLAAADQVDEELVREVARVGRRQAAAGRWSSACGCLTRAVQLTGEGAARDRLIAEAVEALLAAGRPGDAGALAAQVAPAADPAVRDYALGSVALVAGRVEEAARQLDNAWSHASHDPHLAAAIAARLALAALLHGDGPAAVRWSHHATAPPPAQTPAPAVGDRPPPDRPQLPGRRRPSGPPGLSDTPLPPGSRPFGEGPLRDERPPDGAPPSEGLGASDGAQVSGGVAPSDGAQASEGVAPSAGARSLEGARPLEGVPHLESVPPLGGAPSAGLPMQGDARTSGGRRVRGSERTPGDGRELGRAGASGHGRSDGVLVRGGQRTPGRERPSEAGPPGGERVSSAGGLVRFARLVGLGLIGRVDEALTLCGEPAAPAPGVSAEHDVLLGRGMLRLWADDLAGAHDDLLAALAVGADGSAPFQLLVASTLAQVEYRLGRWDEAAAHAEIGASTADDFDQVWLAGYAHAVAALVPAARGEWDLALAHVRAARAACHPGNVPAQVSTAAADASTATARGDHEAAVTALMPLTRANLPDEPAFALWRTLLTDALVNAGRLDEAEEVLLPCELPALGRERRSVLAAAARARAGLLAARHEPAEAESLYQVALGHSAKIDMPFEEARIQLAYGTFLRRRGRRAAAAEQLEAAQLTLSRLGGAAVPGAVRSGAGRERAGGAAPAGHRPAGSDAAGAHGGGADQQRADQPAGGTQAGAQRQDGRIPPEPHLHQARHHLPDRPDRAAERPGGVRGRGLS
nr:AAA family ATPase [Nonomuraea sp. SYSU D8015]